MSDTEKMDAHTDDECVECQAIGDRLSELCVFADTRIAAPACKRLSVWMRRVEEKAETTLARVETLEDNGASVADLGPMWDAINASEAKRDKPEDEKPVNAILVPDVALREAEIAGLGSSLLDLQRDCAQNAKDRDAEKARADKAEKRTDALEWAVRWAMGNGVGVGVACRFCGWIDSHDYFCRGVKALAGKE